MCSLEDFLKIPVYTHLETILKYAQKYFEFFDHPKKSRKILVFKNSMSIL